MDKLYALLLIHRSNLPSDQRLEIQPEFKLLYDSFIQHINSLEFQVEFLKQKTDSDRVKYVLSKSLACMFISMLVEQFKSVPQSGTSTSTSTSLTTTLDKPPEEHSKRDIESSDNESVNSGLLKNVSSVIKILCEKGRFQPQPRVSSISTKVRVRYDKENGHHLVATEDIKFGDILAVTKPYASVMNDKQEHRFCHHCLAALNFPGRISQTVPCTKCSRVLYCSEMCFLDSWKSYHRIECPLLPLSTEGFYLDQYLAFRAYLISGGLDSIREVVKKFKKMLADKVIEFIRNPEDYQNVYQLPMITKTDRHPIYRRHDIEDIIVLAFLAKLVRIDATRAFTQFTDDDILTTESMFRHLAQIRTNGWFVHKSDPQSINSSPPMEYFIVLDPLISLINSSCHPNISIITVDSDLINGDTNPNRFGSNVLLFFAHQPIKARSVLSAKLPWRRPPEAWCPCHECDRERADSLYGADHEVFYSVICRSFTLHGCLERMQKLPPSRISAAGNQYECPKCANGVTRKEFQKIFDKMEETEKRVDGLLGAIEKAFNDDAETKDKMNSIKAMLDGDMSPLFLPHNGSHLSKHYNRLSCLSLRAGFKQDQLKFDFVQIAWNCVEGSRTALEAQFGGDSEAQLRMLRDSVNSFRPVVDWLTLHLAEMNRADKTADQDKRRLIHNFEDMKMRLQKMLDMYKLV